MQPWSKEELKCIMQEKFGEDMRVLKYTCKSASKAGEHYGSTMFALDITIQVTSNSKPEVLHAIAKTPPPTDFLKDVFNFTVTFCKEMNIYKLLTPSLLELQISNLAEKEELIDLLPPFYGSRISRSESDIPDSDAVLLLGNLKEVGYKVANRLNGLDLNHSELVMHELALFHALPIALKMKNPSLYEEVVSKVTLPFNLGPKDADLKEGRKDFIRTLEENMPECEQYRVKLETNLLQNIMHQTTSLKNEPYATVVHNDLWTTNMLFKYNAQGEEGASPYRVKFIDFQTTLLCSPARDIIFFLFTSVQNAVRQTLYEHLLNIYHQTFIEQLKKFHCDTDAFTLSSFQEEINAFAPLELYHILFMLNIIFAEEEQTQELSELTSEDSLHKAGAGKLCRQKILEVLKAFDENGWLK